MAKNAADKKVSYRVYGTLSFIAAVVALVISALALWVFLFTTNMVRTELQAQKIYFPKAGSPSFSAEVYPELQKYAGQQVDNAAKAKAYANGYIGRHLHDVADGKTYSEVSTLQRQNPNDETLKKQKESLLQGETLRGILLGTGYAFGTIGQIAGLAALALAAAGVLLFVLGLYLKARVRG